MIVTFNSLALMSAFIHAEVLLVYGFPSHVIENLYTMERGYYFNRPMLNQRFKSDEFAVSYRTNSQGFRIGLGQEPTHEVKEADWLILGDSFTQGAQVEFEDLYSTKLNFRFPDKVVLNAGISGMGIAHEYRYFVDKGRRLKPSLVILQLGSFNDFMNVEPWPISFTEHLLTRSALFRLLFNNIRYGDPRDLPLRRWVEPFRPTARGNAESNVFYKADSEQKTEDFAAFKSYLRKFKNEVELAGGKLLVLLLPTREQIDPKALSEVQARFGIDEAAIDMRRPNQLVAEFAKELAFDYLDLFPALAATQLQGQVFFGIDEHMTPTGHAAVAKAVGESLENRQGPSRVRLLSRELAGDRYPSPSSDGTLVAYQSIREGSSEVFVASPDFLTRQRVTFNNSDDSHPMLSKDKSRILLTSGSAESMQTDVVIVGLDKSTRKVLTPEPDVFGAIGTFSHSDLKVAYAEWHRRESNTYSLPRIVVLSLLDGSKQYITSEDRDCWRPVFSPDDRFLAYIARSKGQFDLFLYDLETGLERRLTETPFDEWDPQFGPYGHQVVYAARTDGNWDLYLHNLEVGFSTRLTSTKGDEWDPTFTSAETILFAGRFGSLEAIFQLHVPHLPVESSH